MALSTFPLFHPPFGDSTPYSRIGCSKSFLNIVLKAGNDKEKILRSVLRFLFNGGEDQGDVDLSLT